MSELPNPIAIAKELPQLDSANINESHLTRASIFARLGSPGLGERELAWSEFRSEKVALSLRDRWRDPQGTGIGRIASNER